MCIEIRISYPRCSHVHRGYEICGNTSSKQSYCSMVQTHPRIEPICPQCAKLEHRAAMVRCFIQVYQDHYGEADSAFQRQSARELKALQLPQLNAQSVRTIDPKQSWGLKQPQTQARYDFADQQLADDYLNRSNFDRSASDSPVHYSQMLVR